MLESREFGRRLDELRAMLDGCRLCPRSCGVNRLENAKGVCCTGRLASVASAHPHFGEETPLVGSRGSGTIFFAGCNLRCLYCQNYEISHLAAGRETTAEELASLMLQLQSMGCHNLNLVTPTHVAPQILEALAIASAGGFRLPVVYNTGGYDSVETLRLLDGVVDIYMPDVKYLDAKAAKLYSDAENYPEIVRGAVREMHRQVGDLEMDGSGVARRGLLARHLVLPGMLEDTKRIMRFIADEVSRDTYVNVMAQYRPEYRADDYEPISKPLSRAEWLAAKRIAREAGLTRLD